MEKSPIIDVIKKVSPAVVSIIIKKELPEVSPFFPFPFFGPGPFSDSFESPPQHEPHKKVKVGGGSGFIVGPDGIILTNRHVVADPQAEYTVVLDDDKQCPARILARDMINDVAIIKIDGKKFPIIELGDSSKLVLGQTVIAFGTALGLFQNTVSTGIVSGLSRSIVAQGGSSPAGPIVQNLRGLIQTDAAINPGNSGGPLMDIEGKAIGINAAMVLGAENIGFALPIDNAKKDLQDLKEYGRIIQPYIGVRYISINDEIKEKAKLPVNYGALVIRETGPQGLPTGPAVIPGSPAEKAGLKEGDIIIKCNNKKITEKNSIIDILQKLDVGNVANLKILRRGKELMTKVKLEERK